MNRSSMQSYMAILNQVITDTDTTGEKLSPEFETLRTALDNQKVAEVDATEFKTIALDFADGTEVYQQNLNKLENASVPVRILGKHKSLVASYRVYADACDAMTKSLNVADQTIDEKAFDESEATQEHAMDKITLAAQRLMNTPL